MDVVDGEWVRSGLGLTCEFAGVFEGVLMKKILEQEGRRQMGKCGSFPFDFAQSQMTTKN